MDQATMHGAIRGLYEGILDPAAWQPGSKVCVR